MKNLQSLIQELNRSNNTISCDLDITRCPVKDKVRSILNSSWDIRVIDLRHFDWIREQMIEIQKSVWFLQDIV